MNQTDTGETGSFGAAAGFVFDLDGTLADTRMDFGVLRQSLGFPTGRGILEHLETLAGAEHEAARATIAHFEQEHAKAATWIEGARDCIAAVRAAGRPAGILTRNTRPATEVIMTSLDLTLADILTRDDCRAKPDPEGIHILAGRWGLPTSQLLVVGDFLYDLQAARNAGATACLYAPVPRPDFEAIADIVIRDFSALTASLARR